MKNIISKTYSWRFGDIRYIHMGSGEPLLLLHGVSPGASLHEWKQLFARLSKNHRVYAIDLLGFGSSDKPKLCYTSYIYASMINDFICNVINKPTVAAGIGMSGSYAVAAAFLPGSMIKKVILIKPPKKQHAKSSYPQTKNVLLHWLLLSPYIGAATYKLYCRLHHITNTGGLSGRYAIASLINGFLRVNITAKLKNSAVPIKFCDKIDYDCFIN